MHFYQRALQLHTETIAHRRYFHKNAEVGLDMPNATAYVTEQLRALGLDPRPCGHGISATIGSGGKCILLRADMDALPMAEESGEDFASTSSTAAHTCGHDLHAAMLLTAAKMLQEQSAALKGTVKLMFQPAEEILQGAADMIRHGILEDPPVDVALGFHVAAGRLPMGLYMFNADEPMMYSADNFSITVHGKGGHAACPQDSIHPIPIVARICTALEALSAEASGNGFLSLGQIHSGSAANIIPDSAPLEGTIRTKDPALRADLVRRVEAVSRQIAEDADGSITFSLLSGAPPLICDPALTREMAGHIRELGIPNSTPYPSITATASEDFANIAEKVPSAFIYLSAGFMDERGQFPAHNPKVRFHEDVLPIGAACYAHCAAAWLDAHP